jgi:RimJ/RimL family protein N-acetyltransferase
MSTTPRPLTIARKPVPPRLQGMLVTLRPLDLQRDLLQLYAAGNGEALQIGEFRTEAYDPDSQIWRYMSGGPFANADALGQWLQIQIDAPNGCPLTVEVCNHAVGVTNFMANEPDHARIELGAIWYGAALHRTGCNDETTLLSLDYLFALGYRRVDWKCDSQNLRSAAAAIAMGFTYEGQFDQHMIVKGQNRDTKWFRMLDTEWPSKRQALHHRVQRKCAAR